MKFIQTPPSLNGKYEAPPQKSGASAIPAQATTFPEDPPQPSLRTLLYNLSRYQWGSASLLRWLSFLLVGAAAVWLVGWLPGRWVVAGGALALIVALLALFRYWRQRDFVYFMPSAPPVITGEPLPPAQKAPVMVTGFFGVEEKQQRFTWLPGFYRTFATREHALLCQVAQRRWGGLGRWPEDEVGLWYIFFAPATIVQIEWGELYFGAQARPAIAVTHRLTIPKQRRWRRAEVREEKIYMAFTTPAVGAIIWADLHHDYPQNIPTPP
ncbi:MAG: hypothetical protein DYG89_01930 [Caldilinea sp. CFX5]|nr:hypothetical protein [Caldilinea sp. CFX5]